MVEELFFFFFDFDGFEILCFENLAAIEALHVVDAVSSSDHLGAGMVTSGLHNQAK
jgi:hypothetical protein